jgi:hypothetical protein
MNGALYLYVMGLQRRWRDPLLTVLTVLLALLLSVIAPLQAAGAIRSDGIGFALVVVAAAALLVVSGSLVPVLWTLLAVALSVLAAVLRVAHSGLALYSDAAAWVILGLSTGWVVARAVFGPGRVTYHRIVGAILLYLLNRYTSRCMVRFVPQAWAFSQ